MVFFDIYAEWFLVVDCPGLGVRIFPTVDDVHCVDKEDYVFNYLNLDNLTCNPKGS